MKLRFEPVRKKARGLRAMVIGDAMLDRYMYGAVDRISPEAPVPVLSLQRVEDKAGGAANVALNLAAWGCETMLISLCGEDRHAARLAELLDQHRVAHLLIRDPGRPTTVKTRVVAATHHLLRIDEESAEYLTGSAETHAIAQVFEVIDAFRPDLVILEDYNKGFLTPGVISPMILKCRDAGAFIAVDPKERNFFAYEGVHLFKPNLREASHAAGAVLTPADLSGLTASWRKTKRIGTVAVTLGAGGIFLQNEREEIHALPEKAVDVVDVCGAGDAVACALALSLLAGASLAETALLANYTGAYVCSHSGVVQADPDAIFALGSG